MREIDIKTVAKGNQTFFEIIKTRAREHSKPASFQEIFGDFSDCLFEGDLDLDRIGLNSLKGAPKTIRGGYFCLENNPNLKTLKHIPEIVSSTDAKNSSNLMWLYIDNKHSETLNFVSSATLKNLYKISVYTEYFRPSEEDIVANFSSYRMLKGTFQAIDFNLDKRSAPIDIQKLERLFSVYEKVGFDRDKYFRAVSLI